jgi:CBS domain-containing protein
MEKIADVLGRKFPQFNTVIPECLVSDSLYQMICENVDYLIVMEQGKFRGIITDHDIAGRALLDDRPLNQIFVREFMSRTLPVATPQNSLDYCLQLMKRYQVKHLAIFDSFDFRGVVSSNDLIQEAGHHYETVEEFGHIRQGYPWNY